MKTCSRCGIEKLESDYHQPTLTFCKGCHNKQKREYYAANREKSLARKKEYYIENIDLLKEKGKEYNKVNQKKKRGYNQQYYAENRDKIVKQNIQYEYNRKRIDPAYRARKNLRIRIRSVLKDKSFSKKTENMLGLNQSEFKKYIESQFEEGMTWENYGYRGWHLDHSKPLASASSIEEMEKLCHYTNLKPMWGEENMRKGARS
jgi:hypothetical protein